MARFQIRDKELNPIPIKQLDAEAAEFWHFDSSKNPRSYAEPPKEWPEGTSELRKVIDAPINWFDSIGWHITNPSIFVDDANPMTWSKVKRSMIIQIFDVETDDCRQLEFLRTEYFKHYFALINHWNSKGYTPFRVAE